MNDPLNNAGTQSNWNVLKSCLEIAVMGRQVPNDPAYQMCTFQMVLLMFGPNATLTANQCIWQPLRPSSAENACAGGKIVLLAMAGGCCSRRAALFSTPRSIWWLFPWQNWWKRVIIFQSGERHKRGVFGRQICQNGNASSSWELNLCHSSRWPPTVLMMLSRT